MKREMNNYDVEMFFQLEALRHQSKCIDKQVACILTDSLHNIVASGVNTILQCDKNCLDKEHRTCVVTHAERMAVSQLSASHIYEGRLTAYCSLFPCKACQEAILPYVNEIVTYGMIHKDWVSGDKLTVFPHISYTLLSHNGDRQVSVVQGELAELVTVISDYFVRSDKDILTEQIADEIVDVETQLDILKIMLHNKDKEFWNILRDVRSRKTLKVLQKYGKIGVNSYTI